MAQGPAACKERRLEPVAAAEFCGLFARSDRDPFECSCSMFGNGCNGFPCVDIALALKRAKPPEVETLRVWRLSDSNRFLVRDFPREMRLVLSTEACRTGWVLLEIRDAARADVHEVGGNLELNLKAQKLSLPA